MLIFFLVLLLANQLLYCVIQIADVFRSLALPEWGSSLSYGGNKLTLKSNSHLVIATPSSLSNFSLSRLLRNVKILCVDEADVLLTGGEKQMTWNILEEMRRLYHNDVKSLHNPAPVVAREVSSSTASDETECSRQSCETASIHRQIIFTAATLPSRGRKSVQGQLLRWVPKDTLFFDTDQTHQVIPLAQLRFVDIRANEGLQNDGLNTRFEQLVEDLLSLRGNLCTADGSHQEEQDGDLPKVLLFANTVSSAEEIFSHLEKFAAERADIWWGGKLGRLHKMSNVDPEEKERTLHDFRAGNCRVLVSTDLASRGLDLPNVTAVIQVDFPGNSADFLHRAGRTARAGKSGTGIST